ARRRPSARSVWSSVLLLTETRPARPALSPSATLFRSTRPRPGAGLRHGVAGRRASGGTGRRGGAAGRRGPRGGRRRPVAGGGGRSEEHTSELQSRENLVCRRLLEKAKAEEAGTGRNLL